MLKRINKRPIVICFSIVIIIITCIIVSAIFIGDNIYVTLNDNLDSNIVSIKMAVDNHIISTEGTLPFLGGNSNQSVGISPYTLLFMVFPPIIAYYFSFLIKILVSMFGFIMLGKILGTCSSCSSNLVIWCLCGMIYGILGSWPPSSLGFAMLPWWVFFLLLIYKKQKYIYILPVLVLPFFVSMPLMGVFMLFYSFIFVLVKCIKDRKVHGPLVVAIIFLAGLYYILNKGYVSQSMDASGETIKSLIQYQYTDTILQGLSVFFDRFGFLRLYHSGGSTLRYFVIPFCSLFLVYFVIKLIKRQRKEVAFVYIAVFGCIVLNTLACCFDRAAVFRQFIPFASGFSFSRFAWLSPFMWLVLFAIALHFIKPTILRGCCVILALAMVAFDPCYNAIDSMYNMLHFNVSAMLGNYSFIDSNNEWTWREFYSENLLSRVKEEIGYDGEWSAAFGLDTAVLQYNGIKTLDGYYSNYSLAYHDQFQRMIQAELDLDQKHREYWESSGGIRAYLYSPKWDFLMAKGSDIEEAELYIDSKVFYKELNGKYIFSRVRITNSEDLGFDLVGVWSDDESPYTIYVYSVTKDSWRRTKKIRKKWKDKITAERLIQRGALRGYDKRQMSYTQDAYIDKGEIIVMNGGIVYGPYEVYGPGEYEVAIRGSNLNICNYDVHSNTNLEYIHYQEIERDDEKILVRVTLTDTVEDIEFRVFNKSMEEAKVRDVITYKTDVIDVYYKNWIKAWHEYSVLKDAEPLCQDGTVVIYGNEQLSCKDNVQMVDEGFELSQGGIVYGPYIRIEPGNYIVLFYGSGLQSGTHRISTIYDYNLAHYEYETVETHSELIRDDLTVDRKLNNMEFVLQNTSDDLVYLRDVVLIKVDDMTEDEVSELLTLVHEYHQILEKNRSVD